MFQMCAWGMLREGEAQGSMERDRNNGAWIYPLTKDAGELAGLDILKAQATGTLSYSYLWDGWINGKMGGLFLSGGFNLTWSCSVSKRTLAVFVSSQALTTCWVVEVWPLEHPQLWLDQSITGVCRHSLQSSLSMVKYFLLSCYDGSWSCQLKSM